MSRFQTSRRQFVRGSGALAVGLSLKYAVPAVRAQGVLDQPYGAWEDLMRQKWEWDRVVHGSRGINCTGHCAFNIYVKDGIVWREEQQGEYGRSGEDTPDYGPRGCQKGIRQAKYMYSKGRVLYPMKRVGERGEGKWERISWDQATTEIADKFIDYATEYGPTSITLAMGTAMILKRAAFASLFRFANLSGIVVPETFAGVGDLPVGAYQVLGYELPGDNMAAVFKSKVCLVWVCNPAVTRIPDAHFFWEARYNGTEVVTITPDFNASAMHSSKWLNPKPGTDTALALSMVQVIIEDRSIEWDYVREQTDMPFLVRTDNRKFLRQTDVSGPETSEGEAGFYFWDEVTNGIVPVPATGFGSRTPGQRASEGASIELGAIKPALEGSWVVETNDGPIEVTTVFEFTRQLAQGYVPEHAAKITGVHADVIREVARTFATTKPGMIFAGYRANKWLHGDLLLRAWLLMCALTGNTGREGGGVQTTQLPKGDGIMSYAFNGMGPRLNVQAISLWDYVHNEGAETTRAIYGDQLADHFDSHHRQAVENGWIPDFSATPWKMGLMVGHNPGNWRATGEGWRKTAFARLETIVSATPHMSITAMYSDYVLPIADHYEREDFTMEGRTPYVQVINKAVPPLGESVDDWAMLERLSRAISERAKARGIAPIKGFALGAPVEWDYTKFNDLYTTLQTTDGQKIKIRSTADAADFIIKNSSGMSNVSFAGLLDRGFIRVDDADGVQFGPDSSFSYYVLARVRDKKPYETLTGRQQFYLDHDWFMQEGEALPAYRAPLAIDGYELRLVMGHARHGIHSMYRDDSLLLSLQRGEPDVYLNPDDAEQRGVTDGDMVRVFNSFGSFIAMSHVSSALQPKMLFMYHGWDPMMFEGRENFGSVIPTSGLLKPTTLVGGYGHLNYRPPVNVPNQTFHDCTVEFEKHMDA